MISRRFPFALLCWKAPRSTLAPNLSRIHGRLWAIMHQEVRHTEWEDAFVKRFETLMGAKYDSLTVDSPARIPHGNGMSGSFCGPDRVYTIVVYPRLIPNGTSLTAIGLTTTWLSPKVQRARGLKSFSREADGSRSAFTVPSIPGVGVLSNYQTLSWHDLSTVSRFVRGVNIVVDFPRAPQTTNSTPRLLR